MRSSCLMLPGAIAFAIAAPLLSCRTVSESSAPPSPPSAPTVDPATLPPPPGLDLGAMDPKANPCEDFYQFACGGWLAANEIPEDKEAFSRGFLSVDERNERILRDILERAAAGKLPPEAPYAKQLGDFYATCMDEPALEQTLPQLRAELKRIDAVSDARSLSRLLAELHSRQVFAFFAFGATQDFKSPDQVIGEVEQGGLGLPDRDYYLLDDPKTKAVREAYLAHVARMLELAGEPSRKAKVSAKRVLSVESRLAAASLDKVARRDPLNVYHRFDRAGIRGKAPSLPWETYFSTLQAPEALPLNVTHVPFIAEVGRIIGELNFDEWRSYLRWHLIRRMVPALPRAFQEEDFRYTSATLSGTKADRPRWKKCVDFTDEVLGEALGRLFVQQTFSEEDKRRTKAMVEAIERAFEKNLAGLSWMDDATRAEALTKIRKMGNKIGYPEQWRDYSALVTERDSFFANLSRGAVFSFQRELGKIGKPLDKSEWFMSPPTVNAYYSGQRNEMVFPAGILQPPFFNKDAVEPVNFGAMGMVVGHEITHGFDDSGRKFDAEGALRDWWTPASGTAFVARAECVKKQYDGYVAIDDLRLNGALTLGENVADLGGLKLAYAAMAEYVAGQGGQAEPYRFSPSQQFFLGYAQSWCTKYRPEHARVRAMTDPHSPPLFRVNGPLSNLESFRAAFSCEEGAPMVRPASDRCEVW